MHQRLLRGEDCAVRRGKYGRSSLKVIGLYIILIVLISEPESALSVPNFPSESTLLFLTVSFVPPLLYLLVCSQWPTERIPTPKMSLGADIAFLQNLLSEVVIEVRGSCWPKCRLKMLSGSRFVGYFS